MKTHSLFLKAWIGLAALVSYGCSSEASDTEATIGDEAASNAEVLDSFRVAGSTVSFVRYGGAESAIIITEESSALAVGTVIERLMEAQPGLTNLEAFLALAPAGSTPSAALVASHQSEALAQNRTDLSPRQVAFVADLAIEKTAGTCYDFIFAGGGSWISEQNTNLNNYGHSVSSGQSTNHVRAGICIEGGKQVQVEVIGVYPWQTTEWVPAWSSKSWYYLPSTVSRGLTIKDKTWRDPPSGQIFGYHHIMAGRRTN